MIEECARAVATPERYEIASDRHTVPLAAIRVQRAPAGKGAHYEHAFCSKAKRCLLYKAYVTCFVPHLLLIDSSRGLNVQKTKWNFNVSHASSKMIRQLA